MTRQDRERRVRVYRRERSTMYIRRLDNTRVAGTMRQIRRATRVEVSVR